MEKIKINTTPTCPYCKIVKEYMKKKGVDFKEYNVEQDHEALQEMVQLAGIRSVPVITCSQDVMVGFDPDRLDQMINCTKQQSSVPE
jgi:glutaredoxin-like YruB-family protein